MILSYVMSATQTDRHGNMAALTFLVSRGGVSSALAKYVIKICFSILKIPP